MAMVDSSNSQNAIRDYQKKIQELEDKTNRFESIFQNAQICIFHLSHDGKIILSNPAMHKLCGCGSPEQFNSISDIGKGLFVDHREKDSLFKILNNEKTVNGFITKFKKCDGTTIDVSIDASIQKCLTDNYTEFYVQESKEDKLFGKHNHFLSSVVEQLAEGMAIADMDANLLFANSKWISMHGYEKEEELIGRNLSIFHNKKQIEEDVEPFNLKVKERGHYTGEVGHIHKDGSIFPTRMTTTLLRDENNLPYAIAGVATDITDKKLSEKALMESESRYRLLFDLLPYGGEVINTKGEIINCSKSTAKMLGYEVEELIGKNITTLLDPDSVETFRKKSKLIISGKSQSAEICMIRKDGTRLRVLRAAQPIIDTDGKIESIIALSVDITMRKNTENVLKEREQWLSTTLKGIGDAVISTDEKGKVTYMNPVAEELTGWELNEAEGEKLCDVFRIVNAKTKKEVNNPVNMVLETGKVVGLANHTMLISKDGKEYQIADSGAPIKDASGKITGVVLVFRDVTKEYGMQEALRDSENNLRALFNAMTDVVFEMDYNGTYLNIAPTSPEHMFMPSEEAIGKTLHDLFPKPEADKFLGFVRKCLDENKILTIEYPMVIQDKTTWFHGRATPKTENSVFYIATDITALKHTEQELKQSLNVLQQERNVFVAGPVVFFKWRNEEGWPVEYVSPNVIEVFGYSVEELTSGELSYAGLILSDDLNRVADEVAGIDKIDIDSFAHLPYRIKRKDGEIIWIDDHTTVLRNKNGEITHYLGYIVDFTKRKQAEINLKKSEQKYRALFEGINDAVFVHSFEKEGFSNFIEVNTIACTRLGYSKEELLKLSPRDISLTEDVEKRASEKSKKELLKDKWWVFETVHVTKNGNQFPVEISSRVFELEGKPVIMSLVRDIMERKQSEKALLQSEAKFRGLIESSGDWIWEVNAEGVYTYASPQVNQILGYAPEEVVGKTPFDFMPAEESKKIKTVFMEFIEAGKSIVSIENINIHKDGHQLVLETSGVPVFDENGRIVGYQGVDRNITDRKQTEKTIQQQLLNSQALNRIATVVSSENNPDVILETSATIVGETLKTDRAIIYNVDFNKDQIIGLSEWLNNKEHEIGPTLGTFNIVVFGDAIKWLWENRSFIESHDDQVAQPLQQDGSGALLHNNMQIKSGLWIPFNFRDDGFHVLVFNQVLYRRTWQKSELDFIESVTNQISIALQKIKFLDELKKSGAALQSSESKFRLLAENAVDFIFYMDLKFKFKYLSPYVYDSMGYLPEELIGTRLYKYTSRKEFVKIVRVSMGVVVNYKANPVVLFQTKLKHKNGIEIPVEISGKVVLDEKGKPIGLQGSVRDITERYKAEDDLRESEEKWRTLTENSADHIMLLDSEYIIRFINHTVPGLKMEDVIGKSSFDFVPSEYRQVATDCFELVRKKGEPSHYETKYIQANGSTMYFDVRISALKDKNGKITGLISTSNNITERKQAEKEMERLNEKLVIQNDELTESVNRIQHINNKLEKALNRAEESDRLKSSFLANMSHEIRTPMNGILGFASLLKERSLSGEEQQKYIDIIESSGKRMLNIINDLINISKIESGQMKVSLSETDINEQIDYIYTFFKPEAEMKGIRLSISNSLQNTELVIKTDKEKIYAILANLVKNAIKYTKDGFIEIGYILKTDREDAELEFFVKDTGIGIAKNKQKLVFDRFVQADLSLSSNYEGAGLGLSISKAFVEMLNGEIGVESEEGVGSRFYFTIPYLIKKKEKNVPKEENNQIKRGMQSESLNILIAEDEQTARAYLSIIIKDIGKKIMYAETGLEAVKLCRENKDVDLILMDIKMPEMDGYIATSLIREFNKDVIIIAQTAYALATDREKAIKAGCNDYISKPIIKEDLLAIIAKYL